jgi:hypothetical protein
MKKQRIQFVGNPPPSLRGLVEEKVPVGLVFRRNLAEIFCDMSKRQAVAITVLVIVMGLTVAVASNLFGRHNSRVIFEKFGHTEEVQMK